MTAAKNLNSLGWGYRLSQSRPIPRSPDGDKNYANMHASAQYTGLRRLPDEFQQSKMKANPGLITGCSYFTSEGVGQKMTCDDMMTQEGVGVKGLMTKYPLFTEILDKALILKTFQGTYQT